MPPSLTRMLETALYSDDLQRAKRFYSGVLGLKVLEEGSRLVALDAGQGTVLLLFHRGATANGADTPSGRIPPHDGRGPIHLAFAIGREDLPAWEQALTDRGVAIESRVRWSAGGHSIYFRDPDGHSVELATPGVWATY
jgi:catechol 2,3-dioxygenase-like lactoylglutathione lyase family enzyme